MPIEPSLVSSLTWFAHIARHRSFTKAATEMQVTRAALSQHLKALEQRLDLRLLHRTTRDMSLTEEGQRLLDVLQPALTAIERAVAELGEVHAEPSGVIRMTSSRIAARLLAAVSSQARGCCANSADSACASSALPMPRPSCVGSTNRANKLA